jgi:hypothetical protein
LVFDYLLFKSSDYTPKCESYVKYLDLGYVEKRKKLNQHYFYDADTFELINYVLDKCNTTDTKKEFYLKTLLVEGFFACERIYDENNKIIDYKMLDPLTLSPYMNKNGSIHYIQFENDPDRQREKRKLNSEQVLYIVYSNMFEGGHTSLVEQMMITDLSLKKNHVFIDLLIKKLNELDFI